MKKNVRIGLLLSGCILLSGCMACGTAATVAAKPAETGQIQKNYHTLKKEKKNLYHFRAEDYELDYQKQIFINDSAHLGIDGNLEDCDVTYKSSNPSVVSVQPEEEGCSYTGLASGSATIYISIRPDNSFFFQNESVTLKAKVYVTPKAVSIKFRRTKVKLEVGQKKKIKTVIRPSISKELPVFSSSNPEIACFLNRNLLYAKQPGCTYITATISNGTKARCKIIVKEQIVKEQNQNTWDL